MQRSPTLGEFEQLILLAILRLADNAYAVSIRAEIAACAGRKSSPGALYTTLERMGEKGLVCSWFADPTPERGGRAKRFFKLTPKGRLALVQAQKAFQRMLTGLDLLDPISFTPHPGEQ